MFEYLKAIEWNFLDNLKITYPEIKINTLLV